MLFKNFIHKLFQKGEESELKFWDHKITPGTSTK